MVSYKDSGVDIDIGNKFVQLIKGLVKSTGTDCVSPDIGGFGGVIDLSCITEKDPLLVVSTDGVGSKITLARECGMHDKIGIDLVAMCVNDLIVQGARPLFFLDYIAVAKLELELGESIVKGIAEGCKIAGAALVGGETAEMPATYSPGDYDLAGFAAGVVSRNDILPHKNDIAEGDVLLAVNSSGVHSNGFSLVRHIIKQAGIDLQSVCPWDGRITIADELLRPTEIYVDLLKFVGRIKAMAHITGGGLLENIPRVLPEEMMAEIDLDGLKAPAVFKWLKDLGKVEPMEMFRAFNAGFGMVIILSADKADAVMAEVGHDKCRKIGHITKRRGDCEQVAIKNYDGFWS